MKSSLKKIFLSGFSIVTFIFSSSTASSQDNQTYERVWISVSSPLGPFNETLIAFREGASVGVDNAYDSPKLLGNLELSLSSRIGAEDFAIQVLPPLVIDYPVQLELIGNSGVQTLKVEETINFPYSGQIVLEDNKLGVFHNLRNSNYTYTFVPLTDSLRFIVHFRPPVNFNVFQESCKKDDGTIQLSSASQSPWNVLVYNADSLIVNESDSVQGQFTITGLLPGIYDVSFRNSEESDFSQAIEILPFGGFSYSMNVNHETVLLSNAEVDVSVISLAADSVRWDFGDNSEAVISMAASHTYTTAGIFTLTSSIYKDSCIFSETRSISVIDLTEGLRGIKNNELKVYPNPASSIVNIPMNNGSSEIVIRDFSGRIVLNEIREGISGPINVSFLENGIYFGEMRSTKENRFFKLMIKH